MIEQNLINKIPSLSEAEQLPQKKKAKRKRYIKKCSCKQCGKPKSYICLEHYPPRKTGIKKLLKQIRYYSKKLFFNLAGVLGIIE